MATITAGDYTARITDIDAAGHIVSAYLVSSPESTEFLLRVPAGTDVTVAYRGEAVSARLSRIGMEHGSIGVILVIGEP